MRAGCKFHHLIMRTIYDKDITLSIHSKRAKPESPVVANDGFAAAVCKHFQDTATTLVSFIDIALTVYG
jgi:hypothetical protein